MSKAQLRWRGASYSIVLLVLAGYVAIKLGLDETVVGRICTVSLPIVGLAGAYWGPQLLGWILVKSGDKS
jgi:hypothetical protein